MFINPQWRILTIGDGDLSFSSSLIKKYQLDSLTATIFDNEDKLFNKYGDKYYQALKQSGHQVLTSFDVLNPATWSNLPRQKFDLIIFQFPLIPNFTNKQDYTDQCRGYSLNTLHRRLLRGYLIHCFKYFLDPQGQQIAYISSKDVKPYNQWNIEKAIITNTDLHFLGAMKFNIKAFPGYEIRNVDRDKFVPSTNSFTYAFSSAKQNTLNDYINPHTLFEQSDQNDQFCPLCHAGPFISLQDKLIHNETKKHQQMLFFENQWQAALSDIYFSF